MSDAGLHLLMFQASVYLFLTALQVFTRKMLLLICFPQTKINMKFEWIVLKRGYPCDSNGIIHVSKGSVRCPLRASGNSESPVCCHPTWTLHPRGKAQGHTLKLAVTHFSAEPANVAWISLSSPNGSFMVQRNLRKRYLKLCLLLNYCSLEGLRICCF